MGNYKLTYHSIVGIPEDLKLQELIGLYEALFADADKHLFMSRVHDNSNLFTVMATRDTEPVAFKLGYSADPDTFYSWLGGVLPQYRKQGIANRLAEIQEQWAIKQGYKWLKTKSMNTFKPMMMLNLKRGFDIMDIETGNSGKLKIVFQKALFRTS